jgi:N-methylhydantoinase A
MRPGKQEKTIILSKPIKVRQDNSKTCNQQFQKGREIGMRVATDIGGTFTDLVYLDENTGRVGVAKTDTTPPEFEQGVINAIKKAGIPEAGINFFVHGTTVIINALTERKGARTGLITTKGFRDVLELGRSNRADIYNVYYKKPVPFVPRYLRLEVEERVNYKGEVLIPLNEEDVRRCIAQFKKGRRGGHWYLFPPRLRQPRA